jgi:hypothetical protein
MKKTMDDQERSLSDSKTNIIRQEKQLQKLQLLLQKTSNELRESNLQFQAVINGTTRRKLKKQIFLRQTILFK